MTAPQQQVQGTENKYRDCWEDRRSGSGSPSSRRTSRSSAWSGRTGRRRGSTSRWLDTWTGTWSEGPRTRCPCTRLSLNFGSSFWNSRQHWKQKWIGNWIKCELSISPIIQNYVGKPKLIAGNLELFNASKVCGVPFEQIIVPLMIKPHIRRQNLVLFILKSISLI